MGNSERDPTPHRRVDGTQLVVRGVLAAALLVAWLLLVMLAVAAGSRARHGSPSGWWLLALTAVAAAGCLFGCLMLAAATYTGWRERDRS